MSRRPRRRKPKLEPAASIPPTPFDRVATLAPVVAAQAFALWAALNDSLDYYDYQLLVVAELLLVQLSLALTTAPRDRGNRWRNLAVTTFAAAPGLLFFNALLVPIALQSPGQADSPFALVAGAIRHLSGDGLRYAFGYLMLGFGIAMLQARFDAQPLRWWHRHVVVQSGIEVGALIAGTFLLAPVIIARQNSAWVGAIEPATIGVVLIVMMIALRLALTAKWESLVRSGKADPCAELVERAPRRGCSGRTTRSAAS